MVAGNILCLLCCSDTGLVCAYAYSVYALRNLWIIMYLGLTRFKRTVQHLKVAEILYMGITDDILCTVAAVETVFCMLLAAT